jgi:hypothetical protein
VASSDLADDVLRGATALLRERYGIRHVTIQPEASPVHDERERCCPERHEGRPTLRSFLG